MKLTDFMSATGAANAQSKKPLTQETQRAPNTPAPMSRGLQAVVASGSSEDVEILLLNKEGDNLDADTVVDLGGEIYRSFENLNIQAVRLPAHAVNALALDQRITYLSLDGAVEAASKSAQKNR